MAEASAFETDFWKDANLRKVWDDIVPGEPRKTVPYRLTREAIDRQVFGSPTYIYRDELFWGQDRLDFLDRALAK